MSLGKKYLGLMAAILAMLFAASSVAAQANKKQDRILFVVSSLDKKAPNLVGGFWFPELTHPVEVFAKADMDYDIASPNGGLPPFDGFDLKDQATLDFWTNPMHRAKLANSIKLSDVNPSKYTAILLVGGHGPMWDFVNNAALISIVRTMYEDNAIVSAVCHGPAGLINVKLSNGERLIKARHLTGFTAEEERARQYDKIVPFELEAALKNMHANFEEKPIFEANVIVDGRLITGQNPASAKGVGEAVLKALLAKSS